MTNPARLDQIRGGVLDRMERAERNARLSIMAAAFSEMVLFVGAFMIVDFSNHLERLVFVLFMLSYTTIAIGLIALGAHVSRNTARVLGALSTGEGLTDGER